MDEEVEMSRGQLRKNVYRPSISVSLGQAVQYVKFQPQKAMIDKLCQRSTPYDLVATESGQLYPYAINHCLVDSNTESTF